MLKVPRLEQLGFSISSAKHGPSAVSSVLNPDDFNPLECQAPPLLPGSLGFPDITPRVLPR